MGLRITIDCGCDEPHYSFEFDDDDFELWFDNHGVLKSLGIATLPSVGDVVESSEEWSLVEIEPEAFLEWLDKLATQRSSLQAAFKTAGHAWNDQYFWSMEPQLRELAGHSSSEGTPVSVSWG